MELGTLHANLIQSCKTMFFQDMIIVGLNEVCVCVCVCVCYTINQNVLVYNHLDLIFILLLRVIVQTELHHGFCFLVFDDTLIRKQSTASEGVFRQHCLYCFNKESSPQKSKADTSSYTLQLSVCLLAANRGIFDSVGNVCFLLSLLRLWQMEARL